MKLKFSVNYYALLGAVVSGLVTIVAFWSGVRIPDLVPAETMAYMYLPVNIILAPIITYAYAAKMLIVEEEYPNGAYGRVAFIGLALGLVVFIIMSLIAAKIPFILSLF